MAFLDGTQGNVLRNFPVKGGFGYFMDLIRLLFAASLATSFPLTLWECRTHMEQMVANAADDDDQIGRKRVGVSLVLVLLSLVLAVVAKNVSVIFNLFGATACPFLMFILPTWNHLKMHRPGVQQTVLPVVGDVNWEGPRDRHALLVLVGAACIMPAALYSWAVGL